MTFEDGFRDELEKIGIHPLVGALGLDALFAAGEGGYGSYKAIRHGESPLATRIPYNPLTLPLWVPTKALHSLSSPWAKSENTAKKIVGRTGLTASKLMDAILQVDPINAVGGLAHSGIEYLDKRKRQSKPSDFVVGGQYE